MRFNPNSDAGSGGHFPEGSGHRPIALNPAEAMQTGQESVRVFVPGLKNVVPHSAAREVASVGARTRAGFHRNRECRSAQARAHCKSHPLTTQG